MTNPPKSIYSTSIFKKIYVCNCQVLTFAKFIRQNGCWYTWTWMTVSCALCIRNSFHADWLAVSQRLNMECLSYEPTGHSDHDCKSATYLAFTQKMPSFLSHHFSFHPTINAYAHLKGTNVFPSMYCDYFCLGMFYKKTMNSSFEAETSNNSLHFKVSAQSIHYLSDMMMIVLLKNMTQHDART
jgi:hypothetical protein